MSLKVLLLCVVPSTATTPVCNSFHHRGRGSQLPMTPTNTSEASSVHDVIVHSFRRHRCHYPKLL
ncbi:hypothetical protein B296_00022940 [Ensete ventricosum]|uniref:Secreted protein n=1 Tax=Ensete ventricosum TaxID=4639 RepID=A0A426ZJC6_ENSVE|nr:hypothetical protein B296_00022940 [Ensete ventricosum]